MTNKTNNEFERFDALVRKVFSVPRAEILKREEQYKHRRKLAKKKRARTAPASRASSGKD